MESHLPYKVTPRLRVSSNRGCLTCRVILHRMWQVVFHCGLPSLLSLRKGRNLPWSWKVVIHQRSSSIKGCLPLKVIIHELNGPWNKRCIGQLNFLKLVCPVSMKWVFTVYSSYWGTNETQTFGRMSLWLDDSQPCLPLHVCPADWESQSFIT